MRKTKLALSTLLLMGALILPLDTAHANQVQSTDLSEISSGIETYATTYVEVYDDFSLSSTSTKIFDKKFTGSDVNPYYITFKFTPSKSEYITFGAVDSDGDFLTAAYGKTKAGVVNSIKALVLPETANKMAVRNESGSKMTFESPSLNYSK